MRTTSLAALAILASSVTGLVGCSKADDGGTTAGSKTARTVTWSCADTAIAGGSTLRCTASALTSDAPVATGSTVDGAGSGSTSGGTTSGSTGDAPASGGTFDGSETVSGSGTVAGSGAPIGSYLCVAGTAFCPPADATTGTQEGATSDAPAAGDEASSESGAAAGGESGGKGERKGKGGGDDSTAGGASGEGTSGSTSDAPASGSEGGSAGSSGGSSSGPSSYACTSDGKKIDCTRTDATCAEGMESSATGGCVPAGSASGSASGSTGDGPTGGGVDANGIEVVFKGSETHPDGTSTWTYEVTEQAGSKDLSNWVIGTNCRITAGSKGWMTVSPDPNAGITGAKWETGDAFSTGTFFITVAAGASQGTVSYATKAPGVVVGSIAGPLCGG